MGKNYFTKEELDFIIESLRVTKQKFQVYETYPSEEFRKERVTEVEKIITKAQEMKKENN